MGAAEPPREAHVLLASHFHKGDDKLDFFLDLSLIQFRSRLPESGQGPLDSGKIKQFTQSVTAPLLEVAEKHPRGEVQNSPHWQGKKHVVGLGSVYRHFSFRSMRVGSVPAKSWPSSNRRNRLATSLARTSHVQFRTASCRIWRARGVSQASASATNAMNSSTVR